jgi:CspA family cold shock protein
MAASIAVHHSTIEMDGFRSLTAGERVSFEIAAGRDGRDQATAIRKLLGS